MVVVGIPEVVVPVGPPVYREVVVDLEVEVVLEVVVVVLDADKFKEILDNQCY